MVGRRLPWDVPVTLVTSEDEVQASTVRDVRVGVALPGIDGPIGLRVTTCRMSPHRAAGATGGAPNAGREVLAGIAPLWPGAEADLGRVTLADLLRRLGTPVPVLAVGTALQRRVLAALAAVPVGATVTYGRLAGRAGAPGAARAAARVMSTNRVPLVLPCHRVVPAAGGPGAYGWGSAVKAALLCLEGAVTGPPAGCRDSVSDAAVA